MQLLGQCGDTDVLALLLLQVLVDGGHQWVDAGALGPRMQMEQQCAHSAVQGGALLRVLGVGLIETAEQSAELFEQRLLALTHYRPAALRRPGDLVANRQPGAAGLIAEAVHAAGRQDGDVATAQGEISVIEFEPAAGSGHQFQLPEIVIMGDRRHGFIGPAVAHVEHMQALRLWRAAADHCK